jgi:zinc transport system substrate-binding protein
MNLRQKLFLLIVAVTSVALVCGLTLAALVNQSEEEERIAVVATFYPLAYMAQAIGGDMVSVETLVPMNTEIHAWEPSATDIIETDMADVVLYNGAGLEPWFVEEILPVISKDDKVIVDTTSDLSLISDGDGHEGESGECDPHTWVSPHMARMQAERVFDALVLVDPANASLYSENWAILADRFEALDEEYNDTLASKTKSAIFASHAAYGYLALRYGFDQHAIIGMSGDEEPSTSTIAYLVDLMIEHDTYVVYVDPLYREDYASALMDTLEDRTGHEVEMLHLYLMLGPVDGLDFTSQMEKNLENLSIGLETT